MSCGKPHCIMRPRRKVWERASGQKWRALSNALLLTRIFGGSVVEGIGA